MKNLITILIVLLLFTGFKVTAQSKPVKFDTLLLTDNTEVKCNVVEILPDAIKYKKADNPEGPLYTIQKNQVVSVVYKNGTKETFPKAAPAPVSVAATQNANAAPQKKPETADSAPNATTLVVTAGAFLDQPEGVGLPYYYVNFDLPYFKGTDFGLRTFTSGFSAKSGTSAGGIEVEADVFSISLGIAGNYYFNRLLNIDRDKMNIYAGASVVGSSVSTSVTSNSSMVPSSSDSKTDADFFLQVGYKYFLGERFGLNAELDFKDDSAFKIGLCYRFPLPTR